VSDWDHRQLCSDGACVGVIGDDGTCKACGRAAPNWGDERKRGLIEASGEDEDDDDDDEDGGGDDDGGADGDDDEDHDEDEDDDGDPDEDQDGVIDASAGEPADWGQRTLCPDGGCTGVIGESGTCKTCGKAAA
jgi:hypothetical protein